MFSSSEVAEYINATFEPVWETVRAAPLVTIDFGNGTVVRRTLQGNVATYVCGADGTVYDVLPGIYTPDVYRKQLEELKKLADALRPFAASDASGPIERLRAEWTVAARLREYHARSAARLAAPDVVRTVTPQFDRRTFASAPNPAPPPFGGPPATGFAPKAPANNFGTGFPPAPGSLEALARTGGGFKGGGFPASTVNFGGGFQNFGGGFGGFAGQPDPAAIARTGGGFKGGIGFGGFGGSGPGNFSTTTFTGIEGPVMRVIVGAPTLAPPAPVAVPKGQLADRPELKLDTEVNERVRRKAVHAHLATLGIARPNDIKKWLFREVLHADLEDPLLGLGPILNENYPFAEEDRALDGKK